MTRPSTTRLLLGATGALMVGYMSTASTLAIAHTRDNTGETPVSLGYDRMRFLAPSR